MGSEVHAEKGGPDMVGKKGADQEKRRGDQVPYSSPSRQKSRALESLLWGDCGGARRVLFALFGA